MQVRNSFARSLRGEVSKLLSNYGANPTILTWAKLLFPLATEMLNSSNIAGFLSNSQQYLVTIDVRVWRGCTVGIVCFLDRSDLKHLTDHRPDTESGKEQQGRNCNRNSIHESNQTKNGEWGQRYCLRLEPPQSIESKS